MTTLDTRYDREQKSLLQKPQSYTVAELILEQLRLLGVERIYGVVGDAIFGLMDAIAKQEAISFIAVKHESVAALMASAEAKTTGRLGVCIAHMGPGLANFINGLGDAFMDKAPVLAITGQAPLNKIGTFYKQYINQQELVHPVSSFSQLVVHPDAVFDSLKQAVYTAALNRSVSHLSIPSDLFTMTTAAQLFVQPEISSLSIDKGVLHRVLQLLHNAKRPMILVGSEAQPAREAIQNLAEIWGSGIALSYGAIGVIPDSHPLMLSGLGEGGNPLLTGLFRKADVVLVINSAWWPEGAVPSSARIVQVAKYQADLGIPIPAEIGVVGNTANLIPEFIEGLRHYEPNKAWLEQVQHCKQAWSSQNELERNQSVSPLHPASVVRMIEQNIADDAIIALDEGDVTLWFLRSFRAKDQKVLTSGRWRTMGFGLPAAMAAKLCSPEKQVICITGDGGLSMVMADLLTAIRYKLQITVIVFNNGVLQMEEDKMLMKRLQPEGTDLTNPDFAKVAEACGWNSYRISNTEHFIEAFIQSRSSNKPVLLDVLIAQMPHPDFKSRS